MEHNDVISSALVPSSASSLDFQPGRRLIVLVPESEADSALTARKIWELANAFDSRIQLLGLSKDAAHEPGLRRQIVTLSAMVVDDDVFVESKIELGNNWLSFVKSNWHEGDIIVCFPEQRSGIARRPLSQILELNLNATVYVLGNLYPPEKRRWVSRMTGVFAWAGSIAIILGFFWMQAKLTQPSANLTYTVLLYISLFVEAGLIVVWNNLFE